MEIIQGKQSRSMARAELDGRLAGLSTVHLDLGTGDGRYVLATARRHPDQFVIGLDACREGLREAARRAPDNVLFVAANVQALPEELAGQASMITINFPWGSLLSSLLAGDRALMEGLSTLARPGAQLEVRVNGEALATPGSSYEAASSQICQMLRSYGLLVQPPAMLDKAGLRAVPTTWAQRLAFGRDPRAIYLAASWPQTHARWQTSPLERELHQPLAR